MPLSLLPALIVQLILVGFSPGPGSIFALAVSLQYDKRTITRVWLGLLTGAVIITCTLAIAIHFIGIAFEKYLGYLKYLGALYLLFLAYEIGKRKK